VRLGASGHSPKFPVIPHWDELGELAAKTGHGGGDFWVLYHFARQILEGTPAPFDVYTASDCTIPGIQAFRSSVEGGKPFEVPDFRDRKKRAEYREDHFAQPRFDDRNGLFPPEQDRSLTEQFSLTMRDLIGVTTAYRAYRDWKQVVPDMAEPESVLKVVDSLAESLPRLNEVQAIARRMIKAYPGSVAARVLTEMLDLCDEEVFDAARFAKSLKRERKRLERLATSIRKRREAEKKDK
jgi:hypothetical protein